MPGITFVLGGARSGKSGFAERLALGQAKTPVYVATAQAFDDEMQARIAEHRMRRSGAWREVEAPHDLAPAIGAIAAEEVALVDCATLWLSNRMLAEADLAAETATLIDAITSCAGSLIIVSNEVGQGIVPDNKLARAFRDAQGRLNQDLAAVADTAMLVAAGLPLVLKGQLP